MSSEISAYTIGDPGRAAAEVRPGPPTRHPDSADHELSDFEVSGVRVLAASVRGLMHRYNGQPRQDRYSVVYHEPTSTLLVTVCDGVGQFDLSHEAAAFVAAATPRAWLKHGTWPEAVAEVNEGLAAFMADAPNRARLDPAAETGMATTLAAVAITLSPEPRMASIAWIGDSSVWLLHQGSWQELTRATDKDENGSGLHSSRVSALPHPDARFGAVDAPVASGAIFVVSDGIGDPLKGSQLVKEQLAQWWTTPPDVFTFAQQVGFARLSHIDDRTAVGVWFDQP